MITMCIINLCFHNLSKYERLQFTFTDRLPEINDWFISFYSLIKNLKLGCNELKDLYNFFII